MGDKLLILILRLPDKWVSVRAVEDIFEREKYKQVSCGKEGRERGEDYLVKGIGK